MPSWQILEKMIGYTPQALKLMMSTKEESAKHQGNQVSHLTPRWTCSSAKTKWIYACYWAGADWFTTAFSHRDMKFLCCLAPLLCFFSLRTLTNTVRRAAGVKARRLRLLFFLHVIVLQADRSRQWERREIDFDVPAEKNVRMLSSFSCPFRSTFRRLMLMRVLFVWAQRLCCHDGARAFTAKILPPSPLSLTSHASIMLSSFNS